MHVLPSFLCQGFCAAARALTRLAWASLCLPCCRRQLCARHPPLPPHLWLQRRYHEVRAVRVALLLAVPGTVYLGLRFFVVVVVVENAGCPLCKGWCPGEAAAVMVP